MRQLILLALLWSVFSFNSNAQLKIKGNWPSSDTSRMHVLVLKNENVFVGKLIRYDSNEVVFKMNTGDTLVYKTDEVEKVKISPSTTTPISERLVVSPTGFALEKGENEYRNVMFLYNSYHRGVTKNLTIGGGIMPLFISYLGWVDAKFSFELSKNLHIGTGGMFGGGYVIDFSEDEGSGGWNKYGFTGGFGAITIGSREKFINLSVSKIIVNEAGQPDNSPWLYSLGGSYKFGKDNRIFVEAGNSSGSPNEWSVGFGISTLYKRNSFDAGLLVFTDQSPRVLPVIAYAKRF